MQTKLPQFDPRFQTHAATGETESENIIRWVNNLTHRLAECRIGRSNQMVANDLTRDRNPLNEISELKIVKCPQQLGHNCALCVLKNIEIVLENQDAMLNSDDALAFFNIEIRWYEPTEVTELRSIVVATIRSLSTIQSVNDQGNCVMPTAAAKK